MRLKTFRAPTLPAALTRARLECGPDALVLATSEVEGRLGLKSIEITVAVGGAPTDHEAETVRRLSTEARDVPRPVPRPARFAPEDVRNSATAAPAAIEPTVDRPAPEPPALGALDPALRGAAEALVRSGLSEDLALRFARIAAERLGDGAIHDRDALSDAAEGAMGELLRFAPPNPVDGAVLFVVGPPGAGKTSTLVKLAARLKSEGRGPIRIINADRGHPGAAQRLRALATKQSIPVTTLRREADLRRLVGDRHEGGLVLVDTAGIGAADGKRRDELRTMCRMFLDAEVLLVVPAGLHRDEVRRISRRFAALHPSAAVISRVDDGGLPGEVVTAMVDAGLPLGLVTTGRTVPTDLEDASPRRLAALLLRAGFRTGATTTETLS